MITLRVMEDGPHIRGFVVTGHAGYAEAGRDIVCAAVSALVYNAINSCERFAGIALEVTDDGERLQCRVPPPGEDAKVQLLLHSMVFGVEQTAAAYPEHVRVVRRRSGRHGVRST